jgi:hypothetical protein
MNQKSKSALNRYLTRIDRGESGEEEIEPRLVVERGIILFYTVCRCCSFYVLCPACSAFA